MLRTIVTILLLSLLSQAYADDSLRGHAKYQGGYIIGDETPDTTRQQLDVRLNAEHVEDQFESVAHAQLLGYSSDQVQANPLGLLNLPDDDEAALDLSTEIYSEDNTSAALRLDRFFLGYAGSDLKLRIGRQVVTLGNGLAFQTLDRINPFPPLSIDKEYKRGSDMVFAGYRVGETDELQLFVVPQRDKDDSNERARIEADSSTFALRLRAQSEFLGIDYEALVARNFEDQVFGVGFAKDLLGAVVRADYALTILDSNETESSFLCNIDRSAELLGRNIYGYLEFFHNGFGVSDDKYSAISSDLIARVRRGEMFTLGKNYLSPGVRIEVTALLNLYGSFVWNLGDESGVVQSRLVYDFEQNFALTVGVNQPYGGRGSEFGGSKIDEVAGFSKATEIFSRIEMYF